MKGRKDTDKEDVEEKWKVVLVHFTNSLSATVEIGNIGAFSFQKDKINNTEEEYYLVDFISRPLTQ